MMTSNEIKNLNSLPFLYLCSFSFIKKGYIFQERISQTETVEISLTSTGCDLRQALAEKVGLPAHHLKMICRGQVVSMTKSLQEQNVKVWTKTVVSLSTVVHAIKFITYTLCWFGCKVLLMIDISVLFILLTAWFTADVPLFVYLWGRSCSERRGSDADDEHQASCWAPVQQSRKRSAPIR